MCPFVPKLDIQKTFSSKNTDGSFAAAVLNSFLNPLEKTYTERNNWSD